jgi:hypothetical protein
VEKSLSPTWSQQIFVFDIPVKAAYDPKETRNYSLHCTLKSREKIGNHPFLGQVEIKLRDLIHQRESIGWYPLAGKLGQRDTDSVDRIRGSVKIRVQYIHDYKGLIAYYQLCSDRHIETLQKTKAGLQRQLRVLKEKSKEQAETRESISFAGVPSLPVIGKKSKRVSYIQNQKLELLKDNEKIAHSSRIIQGVRDGTENTLKRSIGIAKYVVQRGKKRDSNASNIGIDDDFCRPSEIEDDSTDHEVACDETSVHTIEEMPSNRNGDNTIKTLDTIVLKPVVLKSKQAPFSCRLSTLRDRCKSDPLVVLSTNSAFVSWNTSRAFMHALHQPKSDSRPTMQHNKFDDSSLSNLLQLPSSASSFVKVKEKKHSEALLTSRQLFSKKARRSLSNVVNPGGGEGCFQHYIE